MEQVVSSREKLVERSTQLRKENLKNKHHGSMRRLKSCVGLVPDAIGNKLARISILLTTLSQTTIFVNFKLINVQTSCKALAVNNTGLRKTSFAISQRLTASESVMALVA